jgi:hypothetical protein
MRPSNIRSVCLVSVCFLIILCLQRNHADRLDVLVLSTIIHVDRDIRDDWPLQIYGHDGKPGHIYLKPGDIIFYESATCIHGRPLPLRGSFYANIFAHFKPQGWKHPENIWEVMQPDVKLMRDNYEAQAVKEEQELKYAMAAELAKSEL